MKNDYQEYEEHQDFAESTRISPDIEYLTYSNGKPLNQKPAYEKLINDEVMMQSDSTLMKGKIMGRSMMIKGDIFCWFM